MQYAGEVLYLKKDYWEEHSAVNGKLIDDFVGKIEGRNMVIASVGIYQSKRSEILIFPRWKDNCGIRRHSEKYIIINSNYTECELGQEVLKAIEVSKLNEQEESVGNVYQAASGVKNWRAFQKKYENVEVMILKTGEWKIARYLKQKDHSYGLTEEQVDKYTKIFSQTLSPEDLGKIVLEMFDMK